MSSIYIILLVVVDKAGQTSVLQLIHVSKQAVCNSIISLETGKLGTTQLISKDSSKIVPKNI